MCGLIAAQLSRAWLTDERFDAALATISHRGPDGSASWFSQDRCTALGHVRLSIIGLDNGAQPLRHARGDLTVVVNGEFYGYKAIRDELRAQGYRFATDSDSEIALHLYDEHGLGFTKHLRGEFALVIADRRSGELIAVRDRFGIKPLYYAQVGGDIIFASEIKALLVLGVPARWDASAVMSEIAGLRTNTSMFENIRQVPPGCMAISKNGAVRIERYWEQIYPTAATLGEDCRSEAEVISGFRAVLDGSVGERLTADVEVGCYLSGGLDSSAVLGLAQARLSQPIRAFTIAFEGAPFDESPLAERTAAFTRSNYVPIPVTPRDFADALSDAVWHAEKPIFNGNAIAKFLLSRAVRDAGVKVVFTGEGCDEMLAGYQFDRRDNILFGMGQPSLEPRIAANPLLAGAEHVRKAIGFCPTWVLNRAIMFAGQAALMRVDVLRASDLVAPHRTLLSELDIPGRIAGRDPVNVSLYLWQHSQLINFILTILADRMEMAHSVEGRVPFLDHHVAAYAAGLPMHYKIRGSTEKYVLREATRDVITDEVYRRQKHPFVAPPLSRADPLCARCEDIIRSPQFADQPFYDPAKVRSSLDSLADRKSINFERVSSDILKIASFSLMQQRFGVSG